MKLTVLGSGSTGNAVLIVAGDTRVLVDAGLSAREIARRLVLIGEDVQKLDAVLVTHEHGDHAGGLRVLLRTVDCPVYISAKTCDAYISERTNVNNEEPRKRARDSPASSEEFRKIAATPLAWRASTWSFINEIRGETTTVNPGRARAGN